MPTEDRRVGKLLPSPVTPPDTVCYTIQIPNAVQYRAAFLGQLDVLGRWETWDHQRSANDCADCEEAAQLWRNALYNATFSDECEVSMSCDDVADCIETSEAVQEAIAEQIANNPASNNTVYNTSVYGSPMTDATAAQNVVDSIDCNLNSLFGSVTGIVESLNENNIDFLEILEVQTNFLETVEAFLGAIPVFETLPYDDLIAFVDKLIEQILENYNAQVTTSLIDEYRCDLFCMAKDKPECALSFDDILEYFEDRLGASFTNEQLFTDLVTYFITGTWSGTQVVDMMMLIQTGVWRVTSNWLGIGIRTLQIVGAIGANDPDEDWALLCEDCPVDCYPYTFGADSVQADSGFDVVMGTSYTITATGTFQYDDAPVMTSTPAGEPPKPWGIGICPSAGVVEMIAKIGVGGTWFPVGADLTFTAGSSGRLYFSINEANETTYADNSGDLDVEICTNT